MYGTGASSEVAHWGQGAGACAPPAFSIPEECDDKPNPANSAGADFSVDEFFHVDAGFSRSDAGSQNSSGQEMAKPQAGRESGGIPNATCGGTDGGTYDAAREQEKLCAFLAAAEKHRSRLLWLAKRITNSHEESEDVVQHALLKAFVNLSKFRGDSQMSTWLCAIVQNTAREHMRRQRGRMMLPLEYVPDEEGETTAHDFPDPSETPEEMLAIKERQEMVRSAMSTLTSNHRVALQLCVMDDVPYLHAADMLDVSLSSMKSRVFRGKQLLKVAVARSMNAAI